jgi:hypothetical protein
MSRSKISILSILALVLSGFLPACGGSDSLRELSTTLGDRKFSFDTFSSLNGIAEEVCLDGVDNNQNGETDEGCEISVTSSKIEVSTAESYTLSFRFVGSDYHVVKLDGIAPKFTCTGSPLICTGTKIVTAPGIAGEVTHILSSIKADGSPQPNAMVKVKVTAGTLPPPPTPTPTPVPSEICLDGIDNNQNGTVDEGCGISLTSNKLSVAALETYTLSFTYSGNDYHVVKLDGIAPVTTCTGSPLICTGSLVVTAPAVAGQVTHILSSITAAGAPQPSAKVMVTVISSAPASPTPAPTATPTPAPKPPTSSSLGNQYFDSLVARADYYRAFSLRDPKQLTYFDLGGYSDERSGGPQLGITYSPTTDFDPNAQDAAKVVIPTFESNGVLAAAVNQTDTTMRLTAVNSGHQPPHSVKLDNEIMTITSYDPVGNTITVTRGLFGTTPAPHAAGLILKVSTNTVPTTIRLPIGPTEDGRTYLYTWDAFWTSSYVKSGLTNHKAFQFSNYKDSVWLEVQTNYDGGPNATKPASFNMVTDVGAPTLRSYLGLGGGADWSVTGGYLLGPGVTSTDPVLPMANPTMVIKPNTWVRFWVTLEQRANDYDYVNMWMADENNNAVKIYNQLPVSVRLGPDGVSTLSKFWLEFNTSTDRLTRGDERDLVAYVRNFVILRDPGSITNLLVKPIK